MTDTNILNSFVINTVEPSSLEKVPGIAVSPGESDQMRDDQLLTGQVSVDNDYDDPVLLEQSRDESNFIEAETICSKVQPKIDISKRILIINEKYFEKIRSIEGALGWEFKEFGSRHLSEFGAEDNMTLEQQVVPIVMSLVRPLIGRVELSASKFESKTRDKFVASMVHMTRVLIDYARLEPGMCRHQDIVKYYLNVWMCKLMKHKYDEVKVPKFLKENPFSGFFLRLVNRYIAREDASVILSLNRCKLSWPAFLINRKEDEVQTTVNDLTAIPSKTMNEQYRRAALGVIREVFKKTTEPAKFCPTLRATLQSGRKTGGASPFVERLVLDEQCSTQRVRRFVGWFPIESEIMNAKFAIIDSEIAIKQQNYGIGEGQILADPLSELGVLMNLFVIACVVNQIPSEDLSFQQEENDVESEKTKPTLKNYVACVVDEMNSIKNLFYHHNQIAALNKHREDNYLRAREFCINRYSDPLTGCHNYMNNEFLYKYNKILGASGQWCWNLADVEGLTTESRSKLLKEREVYKTDLKSQLDANLISKADYQKLSRRLPNDLLYDPDAYCNQAVIVALPEPSKVRVITKEDALLNLALQPGQDQMLDAWKATPYNTMSNDVPTMLKNIMAKTDELIAKRALLKGISFEQESKFWCLVSGDYSAATNKISKTVGEFFIENIPNLQDKGLGLASFRTGMILNEEKSKDGKQRTYKAYWQIRGQKMGHPWSFPILCAENLAVWRQVLTDAQEQKLITKEERKVLWKLVIVNGDDIAFRCPLELVPLFYLHSSNIGFEISKGKNYVSKDWILINSRLFHASNGMKEVGFLNQKFVDGFDLKSGDRNGNSRATPVAMGRHINSMCTLAPWTAGFIPMIMARWKSMSKKNHFSPSWHLPAHLGGFGIDPQFLNCTKVNIHQRKLAHYLTVNQRECMMIAKLAKLPGMERFRRLFLNLSIVPFEDSLEDYSKENPIDDFFERATLTMRCMAGEGLQTLIDQLVENSPIDINVSGIVFSDEVNNTSPFTDDELAKWWKVSLSYGYKTITPPLSNFKRMNQPVLLMSDDEFESSMAQSSLLL